MEGRDAGVKGRGNGKGTREREMKGNVVLRCEVVMGRQEWGEERGCMLGVIGEKGIRR